jgi:translocation and assembly module TamA
VHLERAPRRTIAAELGYVTGQGAPYTDFGTGVGSPQLGYGTGEGARAEVSWTNRDMISPEGAVTFRGVGGTREQSLAAQLRQNNFYDRDRALTAQVIAAHVVYDAYDARTFAISAGLERQSNIIFQKKWTWSIGTEFVATDERDSILSTGVLRRRTFLVGALPGSIGYDCTDDLLNPTRCFRLTLHLSPEVSLQSGTHVYLKSQIDGSAYLPITGRTVLAGRFRFGSIEGTSLDSIAPSRRFYAGGGGSVRGYGYQDIGPTDVNGLPVGGRALTELSVEARIRFGNLGVVPFLDAGNLDESAEPKFSGLRYGAGLGFRYYSSFGPIRVDLGTPINRRPGESRLGIYVSLGQAF